MVDSTKPFAAESHSRQKPADKGPPVVGFLVIAVIFLIAGFWRIGAFRGFLLGHWQIVVAGILILLCCLMMFESVRHRFKQASVPAHVAFVMLLLLCLMALVIGGVLMLPERSQIAALVSVFLLAACFFPPVLYYLFISTRKYSLLNEFILNLDRLGLLNRRRLAPQCVRPNEMMESNSSRQLRIRGYLERFEAQYGPLDRELVTEIVNTPDNIPYVVAHRKDAISSAGLASVFNQGSTAPLIISTVLIALGWLLVLPPMPLPKGKEIPSINLFASPVCFAFLGAYFFAIQMLFRRYIRKDLRGPAYTAVSMRILLAVIGTWVVMEAKLPMAPALAFLIGFFPPVLWQILRKVTKFVPPVESALPLSDLDGLNLWHQTRLEEEDVENIPNMATADIVDLLLNTRIPPDRVIDWVDQAILYTHLPQGGDDRAKLRAHGIRTASGFLYAYERSECKKDVSAFEMILPSGVDGRAPIRGLAMALFTNPNLCLIQAWRGLAVSSVDVAEMPTHDEESHLAMARAAV